MPAKEFREPVPEEIALAAYYRWQAEGCPAGREEAHWFAAETALMQKQADHDGTHWARESES